MVKPNDTERIFECLNDTKYKNLLNGFDFYTKNTVIF